MSDDQNKKPVDDLDLSLQSDRLLAGPEANPITAGDYNKEIDAVEAEKDDLDIFSNSPSQLPPYSLDPRLEEESLEGGGKTKSGAHPEEMEKNETIILPKAKILLLKKLIANIKENADQVNRLISPFFENEDEPRISIGQMADDTFFAPQTSTPTSEEKIIEGVFDGEKMIGPDGKQYSVPANYASKSKLVEGDMMKLTITSNGTFLYKQIGPVERGRIVGELQKDAAGFYYIAKDEKHWRVLTASITYFRGEVGDEVIILVPKYGQSAWAAVENIIKKK